MNDFDAYEKEEAAKRAATYNREAMRRKAQAEQTKHDAGIGVETAPAVEDDEDEE
jgi:hypothetical protein